MNEKASSPPAPATQSGHKLGSVLVLGETGAVRYLDLNLRDGSDNRRLAEESLELADWVKVNDDELVQLLAWQDGAAIRSEPWGSPAFQRGVATTCRFTPRGACAWPPAQRATPFDASPIQKVI